MSIDKGSPGFPEVNVHRRTTKVNLSIVVAVLVFFAIATGVAYWISQQSESPEGVRPGPTQNR